MSVPKSKTIPEVVNTYLIMLGIYCLDLFFLKSDLTVLGDSFYSRFVCFVVLFILMWVNKTPADILGVSKNKKKIMTGIVYGIIFSVIPIIIAMVSECVYYGFTDISAINLRFTPPSLNYIKSTEHMTPATAILIYMFSTLFGSAFKEVFFRGFVLKKLKSVMDFKSANLIQALLYMSLIAPYLLRNLINHYYDDTTTQLGIFIVIFYLLHETIAGIKWGLITRVTGSTNVAIIDHFLYVFLANSVYITDRYVTWSFMTHMMAIQLISLGIVLIYYKINMKKVIEKRAIEEAEKAAKKKAHEERKKALINSGYIDEKLQAIDSISPDQFKGIIEKASNKRHHSSHHSNHRKNENNSKINEGIIESLNPSQAAEKAEEYLENRLSNTHYHNDTENPDEINRERIEAFNGSSKSYIKQKPNHTHHMYHDNDTAEKINSEKIESFSSEEIEKKTTDYSNSLEIERKNPKRPNPNDKIAMDSLLPIEIIDKENSEKLKNFSEDDIDNFLSEFSNEKTAKNVHHHSSHNLEEKDEKIDDLTENFNADDFLVKYQKQVNNSSTEIHHHHHHHHSNNYRDEEDVASMTQVNTENFYDEYKKTKEVKHKHRSLLQTVKDLGELDDSESNDLL